MNSLALIVENNTAEFLAENYNGAYTIIKQFSVEDFKAPCIYVGAGNLTELEPSLGVFNGTLNIATITQIDETESPLAVHDSTVNEVYHLIATQLQDFFNQAGNGHMWAIHSATFEQDRQDRTLITILEFQVTVQTLTV